MSLSDVMPIIDSYDPKMQSKIRYWYPKLQVAQKAAFDAWKEMEMLFKEPPIFVISHSYMERRNTIKSAWQTAWAEWENMSNGFETASCPEEEIEELRRQVAALSAQLSGSPPKGGQALLTDVSSANLSASAPTDDQNPKSYN
jgi:hypothetical protein